MYKNEVTVRWKILNYAVQEFVATNCRVLTGCANVSHVYLDTNERAVSCQFIVSML